MWLFKRAIYEGQCYTIINLKQTFLDIEYDYPTRDVVILKCNINDAAFVISQVIEYYKKSQKASCIFIKPNWENLW